MTTESTKETDLKKYCIVLYGLYAISALLQVSIDGTLFVLSIITLIIAGIMGRLKKTAAKGTPYESHLRWLYRTAWIASCVAIPINFGLSGWLIWTFTDFGAITRSMDNGDMDALTQALQNYMDANTGKIFLFNAIGAAPPTLWWLHRCWRGYVPLKEGQPVENVTTWL
jgi:uncharacterized membrane protein